MLIAHFSDMHVKGDGETAFDGVDTAGALERCVNHINSLDPSPDVVLITGDLAFNGEPNEYGTLRALLSILDAPSFFIPGNHDDRSNIRAAFPDLPFIYNTEEFIQYTVDEYEFRLIGLDTIEPGKEHGILCPQRLDWLELQLSKEQTKQTIIFMHHPPFRTAIEYMDQNGLANANQFAEIVTRHEQIRLILCGHVHRPICSAVKGVSAIAAPGTAHQISLELRTGERVKRIMEPPALYLHLLEGGQRISHLSYIGDYGINSPFATGYLTETK